MEQTISKCLQFQPSILFFFCSIKPNRLLNLCRMEVFQAFFFLLNGQVNANFLFQELWFFFNIQKPHVLLWVFFHFQYVTNTITFRFMYISVFHIQYIFLWGKNKKHTLHPWSQLLDRLYCALKGAWLA